VGTLVVRVWQQSLPGLVLVVNVGGTEIDYSVGRWIGMLHHKAMAFFAERMAPYGLPPAALPLLRRLLREPASSQDELSRFAIRDKANVSRVLDKLEADGFVTRSPDPNDSRVNRVCLTDRGRELEPVVRGCLHDWNDLLTQGFTEAERESAVTLLRRMAENCGSVQCADAPPNQCGGAC